MAGSMIEFASNGGKTTGYLATPAAGKGPGVLVLQEWWGLVGHIKSVCDRFAAEGFTALAPDMYHGKTATEPDGAGKLFMALNIAQASILRAWGHTRDPMLVNVLSLVLTVLGNALCLFGPFGFPVLGVTGVAASTVLSQMVCASVIR